jgi:structural maintenance of chromosome 3 (chondroitin sulfate proteoglycan 6)
MVTKLNYASKYDKALRYIFGKTLICRNLEVATNLAKTSGLDCVTLEGDQVCSVTWSNVSFIVTDIFK